MANVPKVISIRINFFNQYYLCFPFQSFLNPKTTAKNLIPWPRKDMCHYFIANIKINNEDEYKKYLDEVDEVFSKFKGEYLAVDNNPTVLEGNWKYSRTVVIKFDTMEDFNAWYHSEKYQKILKYRLTAADCDTILIKGNGD